MILNYKKILFISLGFICCVCQAQVNNEAPYYSESEKNKSILKMRELASKSQTEIINSSSNYNKAMFDAVQKGYGGYSDINVEFDDKHTGLSSAEKKSIENTRRNVEIMKEQLKGLK
ncbi:hypothetical protein IRT38_00415 (plasmid) [Acinetobacter sp. SK-43]|uniref:hypothetical protein n=1 Tax=Acinetobacter sp. SK-43 TaxID=2785295 RepID=UPI00188A5606|nr:hypothetical protein [Acinetobacter sp. SK-43]MBF4453877.1 hypothetical protein [Acinetobacter sp. SK-43]